LNRIEESAGKRLAKHPHSDGGRDASVALLLFEARQLSA
jgi:hypothetical protein